MKSILLVEDDPFLIDIYTTKLKAAGFKIEVAENGEVGLRKIKELSPDLLILDIVLPHIDGWEILRKIRQEKLAKRKGKSDMKIIVLSNLGQKAEVEKGLKLAADKYLIKAHYTPTEVVEEIKKTIT